MGKRYLLDTNIVIDFSANRIPEKGHKFVGQVIDSYPQISIITKIELLGFSNVPKQIETFTKNTEIVGLDDSVVQQTISLRKKHRIKLPDAVIAGTAIENNLILITRNVSDFKNIKELKCINPHEL